MSRKTQLLTMFLTVYVTSLTLMLIEQADGIGSGFLRAAFRQG